MSLSYLNRRCPSESTVSSSSPLPSAYGDGLACPLGSPMATAIAPKGAIRLRCFGYCAPWAQYASTAVLCARAQAPLRAYARIFFSMATMPETMAPKLDRHNERSFNPNPMIAGVSSPWQRRVMNVLPSVLSPLGLMASSPRQSRVMNELQSILSPLGLMASSPRQRRG